MNKTLILLSLAVVFVLGVSTVYLLARPAPFVYDATTAESLAGYSMAAYCNAKQITKWNCGAACKKNPSGLTDVFVMKNKTMNAGGYIGYSPSQDAITVIFRGTVPWLIKNWITDIDTVKVDYPLCPSGCKVHKGFYLAFKELQDQVITQFSLLKAKYPNAKVFVGGHSLGAAMSTHAVPIIYQLNGGPIDAFYNFGSPRVGDEAYSDWFDGSNFALQYSRVTHYADPVPHLPPEYTPFKFIHIGQEVYYKSFKKAYTQCLYPESNDCADGVKVALSIPDHLTYYGWDWATAILACQ